MPFALGLLVFTFIFIIPPLLDYAEDLVAKGVSAPVVIGLVAKLIPQALAITIPMSLLLALLIAFGRLSADREFVAMQACGVSLRRLLRPVAVISITAWAVTSYVLLDLVPGSNQRFLDTIFAVASQRAEGEVKPRTFFTEFPNLVLYVRDIAPAGGGWIGVFMADLRPGQRQAVYLAERGRVLIDRERQRIDMDLLWPTIAHEIGHELGIWFHVDAEAGVALMNPTVHHGLYGITELDHEAYLMRDVDGSVVRAAPRTCILTAR